MPNSPNTTPFHHLLPPELLSQITTHLPTTSLPSFLLTSRHIYTILHPLYLHQKFQSYTLYPTSNSISAFLSKTRTSPFYRSHLKHLKISLQCPQFSRTQIKWLYTEYIRGRILPDGGLLPNLQPLLTASKNGVSGHENCKLSSSTTNLILILQTLENLQTVEFINNLEPIPFKDCIHDNEFNGITISELEKVREATNCSFSLEDFSLQKVVPWVFEGLYAAKRPLVRVLTTLSPLLDDLKWVPQSKGVGIPKFPEEEYAIEGYQNVLGGLRTLEMKVAGFIPGVWVDEEDVYPDRISGWFETLKGLEELVLSHDDDSRGYIRQNLPQKLFLVYPLRIDAVLPRLKKLKLRRCELQFDSLTTFLVKNGGSIRNLILEENEYYEPFGYPLPSTKKYGDSFKSYTQTSFSSLLTTLSNHLTISYFSLDIPGKPATEFRTELIYFSIQGRWNNPATLCEVRTNQDMVTMSVEDCLEYVRMVLRDAVEEFGKWKLRRGMNAKGPDRYRRVEVGGGVAGV